MTKRQKGYCSSPGCHEKWDIDLVIKMDEIIHPKYFCAKDFIRFIGYYSNLLFEKAPEEKEILLDGVSLYRD